MSAYSKLMDEHLDLQKKYDYLIDKFEKESDKNEDKKQNFGAMFMFENGTSKKIPILGDVVGIETDGIKPIQCLVNFTTKMLTDWMDKCNAELEKKTELIEDIKK